MSEAELEVDEPALRTRLALLEEENRRLRAAIVEGRRTRYRRTALGMMAIGVTAFLAGVVFVDTREVLFALAGIGLFAGVLTLYLTPERFVAATVSEAVYGAMATNAAAICETLGLRDRRIYLPPGDGHPARLFIPQYADPVFPIDQPGPLVLEDEARGLLLEATGDRLVGSVAGTGITAGGDEGLGAIAARLAETIVETLELASSARVVDVGDDLVTIAVSGSTLGSLDRLDHPVPSVLAAGIATELDRPVDLEVTRGDDRSDWLVTVRLLTD